MTLANRILTITLAAVFSGTLADAQTAATPAKSDIEVRTFFLNNALQNTDDAHEIQNALRSALPQQAMTYLDSGQNALVIRATPDDLAIAQKIINDLDRPKKTYRLTYTVTETDGTRRISAQHFAMVLISGQRTSLKDNSQVPIASGSYSAGGAYGTNNPVQTQFTYTDAGLTFDATLTETGKAVRLQSSVSQSGVAAIDESNSDKPQTGPAVRRSASLEGAAFLTAGKPLVLGSLDIPGSTRHLEVEVVMEEVH